MKNGNFLSRAIFLLSLIAAVILQTYFQIFSVKPDLSLLGVVLVSLIFNAGSAFALAIFFAILNDALTINKFGMNVLLFPLYVFLIKKISKSISLDNSFIRAGLVFGIAVLHAVITRFSLWHKFIALGISLKVIFIAPLYTALISLLLFKSIKFLCIENAY